VDVALGTSCRWVVSFTVSAPLPPGKEPRSHWMRERLRGPQSRSGRYGKEKILDLTGTRTPTPRSLSPWPLRGPQSRSGRYGEEKILDLTGTRTPTPRSPSPWPVAYIDIIYIPEGIRSEQIKWNSTLWGSWCPVRISSRRPTVLTWEFSRFTSDTNSCTVFKPKLRISIRIPIYCPLFIRHSTLWVSGVWDIAS
jgi:hypothetical protein